MQGGHYDNIQLCIDFYFIPFIIAWHSHYSFIPYISKCYESTARIVDTGDYNSSAIEMANRREIFTDYDMSMNYGILVAISAYLFDDIDR